MTLPSVRAAVGRATVTRPCGRVSRRRAAPFAEGVA